VLSRLAREYALCDQWFSSMPGPTWPNRFFLHAATSGGLDRSPTGMEIVRSQFGGYRFENGSIYEALNGAGLDWRIYCGDPLPQVSALSVMDLETMRGHYRRVYDLRDDLQDSGFSCRHRPPSRRATRPGRATTATRFCPLWSACSDCRR
jgi:phospholipase C